MLILLIGAGSLAFYQVQALEDRLGEVTSAIDRIDPKVKQTQHDKALFYALARDVLNLAPKDANAEQIVVEFHLRELKAIQPTLFDAPSPKSAPDTETNTVSNVAPATPPALPVVPPTNAPNFPVK
jgi:hypothetical protein